MNTLDNMIQALENALTPTLSPIVLNGDGFGLFANYSLAMANYIAGLTPPRLICVML